MKKKIIIITIAVVFGFYTWFIGWFFSNYRIRSPIEPVIRTPVSDVTSHILKNKRKTGTGAVFAQEKPTTTSNSIEDKIKATFPEEPEIMLAVAKGESGLRNEASSWCCHGILQIHEEVHKAKIPNEHNKTKEDRIAWLRNPDNNLKIARILYDASGKGPWEAYTNGSYLQYLQKYL